jgi:transposase
LDLNIVNEVLMENEILRTTVYNGFAGAGAEFGSEFLRRWRSRRSRPTLDSTHVKAHRCAGGGKGGPRNRRSASLRGRNSKLHALVDRLCQSWVIILTLGNNIADCTVGPECVSMMASIKKLLGDKAYDSDAFRELLRQDGITPVIPGRSNRKKHIRYDKKAYKGRNVI